MSASRWLWFALPMFVALVAWLNAFGEPAPYPGLIPLTVVPSFVGALFGNGLHLLTLVVGLLAPYPFCRAVLLYCNRRWGPLEQEDRLGVNLLGFVAVQALGFAVVLGFARESWPAFLAFEAIVAGSGLSALRWLRRTATGPDISPRRSLAGYAAVVLPLLGFGGLSVSLGQDFNYDYLSYHYYSGYAFLYDRAELDIAVGNFEGYFNPLLDAGYHLLAERLPPSWVGFLVGATHGIAFVLLWLIGLRVLGTIPGLETVRGPLALACAVAGVAEPMFLTQLGTTFHDNFLTSMILLAVLLVAWRLGRVDQQRFPGWTFGFAGLWIGLAIGLKLTAASFAPGMLIALGATVPNWRRKVQSALSFGAGTVIGFLITNGFWMIHLYEKFGNPIFPFYNAIFRSPYWPEVDLNYLRETTFPEHLLFPFALARADTLASETLTRDPRLALLATLALMGSIGWGLRRIVRTDSGGSDPDPQPRNSSRIVWLVVLFVVASYAVWQWKFRILRYLVTVKVLAPLVCVLLALELLGPRRRGLVLSALLPLLCVVGILVPTYGRRPWSEHLVKVSVPPLAETDNAVVLLMQTMSDGNPMSISAVVTGFPASMRFINVTSMLCTLSSGPEPLQMQKDIDVLLAEHDGPLYLLTPKHPHQDSIDRVLDRHGLELVPWDDVDGSEPYRTVRMERFPLALWMLGRRPPRPAPSDFDGDGKADLAVVRHDQSWLILESSRGSIHVQWFGDALPVPADYDGDGRANLATFHPDDARWLILGREPFLFGQGRRFGGDPIPVPADYDGDGLADPAVFQPETAEWSILRSRDHGIALTFGLGRAQGGDPIPVPADYDGDGITDLAVFQPETAEWSILRSREGPITLQHGQGRAEGGNPIPVPADYDGDGLADLAVFQPETAEWSIRYSSKKILNLSLGIGTQEGGMPVPVPSDYDGNGIDDLAVFNVTDGRWTIRYSASGKTVVLQPFETSGTKEPPRWAQGNRDQEGVRPR